MYKSFEKAMKAFESLDTVQDLKRAGITYSDYLEIASDFQILKVCGEVETISFNVAQWFMKHGAKVEPCGIGWRISF